MNSPVPFRPASGEQEQFLDVLPREEALRRFEAALDPKPVGIEHVPLAAALGRVAAQDIDDVGGFNRQLPPGRFRCRHV